MVTKNDFHVGRAIRTLRRQQNLTGEELARKAGLSQSKISRIETGASINLKTEEVKKILHILNAPQTILQRAMTTMDGRRTTNQTRLVKWQYPVRESLDELRKTSQLRVFTINLIPALLQTIEYEEARFGHLDLAADDVRLAMRTTSMRQDMLWDKRHVSLHHT
jgi:transcriptional regulator with XRE-family HTH domain